jgi:hypothetical protein
VAYDRLKHEKCGTKYFTLCDKILQFRSLIFSDAAQNNATGRTDYFWKHSIVILILFLAKEMPFVATTMLIPLSNLCLMHDRPLILMDLHLCMRFLTPEFELLKIIRPSFTRLWSSQHEEGPLCVVIEWILSGITYIYNCFHGQILSICPFNSTMYQFKNRLTSKRVLFISFSSQFFIPLFNVRL